MRYNNYSTIKKTKLSHEQDLSTQTPTGSTELHY